MQHIQTLVTPEYLAVIVTDLTLAQMHENECPGTYQYVLDEVYQAKKIPKVKIPATVITGYKHYAHHLPNDGGEKGVQGQAAAAETTETMETDKQQHVEGERNRTLEEEYGLDASEYQGTEEQKSKQKNRYNFVRKNDNEECMLRLYETPDFSDITTDAETPAATPANTPSQSPRRLTFPTKGVKEKKRKKLVAYYRIQGLY